MPHMGELVTPQRLSPFGAQLVRSTISMSEFRFDEYS